MIADQETLMVRIAELYYDDGRTQDEIGSALDITRWKVGRLLTEARERGIVKIEIIHPRARRLGLESQLRQRWGLSDAIVVATNETEARDSVARAAADYLSDLKPTPEVLGVSWGKTLSDVAECLADNWANGISVVQINGGVSLNKRSGAAAETAVTIANKGAGHATLLPSPAILERRETKRAIESDRTVAGVLELAATASAYLYSAGVADESSVLVESGYLSADDVAALVRSGAVGDVVGRYINAEGATVDPKLDQRTVGLKLDQLRAATTAVFVVAGAAKHPVAKAVVSSGLCTVIVTDEATAQYLLAQNVLAQNESIEDSSAGQPSAEGKK